MTVLMEGIVFGESPRWHEGRVWFSDWGAHQVIALDPDGHHEVIVSVASFPMCIDFLPDGRLLVVDSAQRRLLRRRRGTGERQAGPWCLRLHPQPRGATAALRRRPAVGRAADGGTDRAG